MEIVEYKSATIRVLQDDSDHWTYVIEQNQSRHDIRIYAKFMLPTRELAIEEAQKLIDSLGGKK